MPRLSNLISELKPRNGGDAIQGADNVQQTKQRPKQQVRSLAADLENQ